MESAGTGIYRGCMFDATGIGEFAFEGCDFTSEDELRAVEHAVNGFIDLGFDGGVLRLKIQIRNRLHVAQEGSWRRGGDSNPR